VLQSESEVDVVGLMTAMQSNFRLVDKPVELTYGVDLQREKDSQSADGMSLKGFQTSNGTAYQATGKQYAFGPDVELKTIGVFTQSSTRITEQLAIKAGVRFEQIESSSSSFTPTSELLFADYLAQYRLNYPTADIASGDVKHHATLFNLGAVYDLDASQQLFANYSQGFSLPDMQRTLRDVQPGFVVKSENVDPITVDSIEAGWRTQIGDTGSANVTGFYNSSDKVVQFQRDFSVNVADTDERFYGAEAALSLPLTVNWSAGGSLAYTRGQFKDSSGTWRELNAYRATPLKSTLFGEWNNRNGQSVRLQMLAISGSDRAYDDSLKATYDSNVRATSAAKIQGYAVLDLIAQTELPQGKVNVGLYNMLNRDYQTVYSQEAVATYGKMSGIPAEGRTVAMSYSIDY
jgi:iron complex outermembrane receptor protein